MCRHPSCCKWYTACQRHFVVISLMIYSEVLIWTVNISPYTCDIQSTACPWSQLQGQAVDCISRVSWYNTHAVTTSGFNNLFLLIRYVQICNQNTEIHFNRYCVFEKFLTCVYFLKVGQPVDSLRLVKHTFTNGLSHIWIRSWWRHQMETFSALLATCAGNSSVPGEFPAQRPVTRSFYVFFDLRLNKRLSKQWWGW